jgi:CPW-WPC domain-containing protein
LLDTAAHVGQSEEEQNIRRELSLAMTGEPVLDTPDITSTITYSQEATPDYSKCPDGWLQQGSVCTADDAHAKSGTCGARMDLGSMSTEQKLAFERFCNVQFPRAAPGSCDMDFEEACPSEWREVGENLCQAPDNYHGTCDPLLNTQGMTAEDKQRFGIQCGASWPCSVQSSHGACKQNYNAPCPFGWKGGTSEPGAASCTAPTTYTKCGRVQDFEHMSPWEKQEWAIACAAPFPCIDRSE